jgi:hypothetical protein
LTPFCERGGEASGQPPALPPAVVKSGGALTDGSGVRALLALERR